MKRIPIITPYQSGKYTVSPLSIPNANGRYSASVSIRSGRGSQSCDRVFRFAPTFETRDEASRFIDAQARAWLRGQTPSRTSALPASNEDLHG